VITGVEYDEDVYIEVDDDERTDLPSLIDVGLMKISLGGCLLMVERRLIILREELIRLLPVELLEVPARRCDPRSAARALLAVALETLP